jgi:VWFA-related protein
MATARGAAVVVAVCLLAVPPSAATRQPPAQPDPQRQVFRAGAHFVRVDAYPIRDGRIVEGLTRPDFELLEDGRPQAIETFEYVDYSGFTPEAARRDPNSQRDAFNLAADPRYRIFVLYLDAYHVPLAGSHAVRRPIVNLLNRILGPQDLFGVLTPAQRPLVDLMLGQQTLTIEEQLARHWDWGQHDRPAERSDEEIALEACFGGAADALIALRRLDKVFRDLQETVMVLDGLRDERKNLLLFSRGWRLPRPAPFASGLLLTPPQVGVTDAGKLTLGNTRAGMPNRTWCQEEALRLPAIDFVQRHRDLIASARQANVTIYPVNPMGLEAAATVEGGRDITYREGGLREMAENTDGIAITMTNNLDAGLKRMADDLRGMYVLGYYTTNTTWDGAVRRITVRLASTGERIRARREYRAPTEAGMEALRNPPAAAAPAVPGAVETAFGSLASIRPGTTLHVYGRVHGSRADVVAEIAASRIEAGRYEQGGDVQIMIMDAEGEIAATGTAKFDRGTRGTVVSMPLAGRAPWNTVVRVRSEGESPEEERLTMRPAPGLLLGDPLVFRAAPAPAAPKQAAAAMQFRRTERLIVEWPLAGDVERWELTLVGRDGRPLDLDVPGTEQVVDGVRKIVANLNLAPLWAGEYAVELRASAPSGTGSHAVAFRLGR